MLKHYYPFSAAFHAITFCKPQTYRAAITITISRKFKCPLQDHRPLIPVVAQEFKPRPSEG